MQQVSERIWTRVAVSISYDDNHYTTVCSLLNGFKLCKWLNSSILPIDGTLTEITISA